MSYCENCGNELTSLFCETCGTISTNIPTSLSNDESLAGLLANVINQGKSITFTQVLSITKSVERTYRIFSQLEKTKNFLITRKGNEYIISPLYDLKGSLVSLESMDKKTKFHLLYILLEMFPLSLEELAELIPSSDERHEFLKKGANYFALKRVGTQQFLQKKN